MIASGPSLSRRGPMLAALLLASAVGRSAPLPARVVVAPGATETEVWAAAKVAELLALPLHSDSSPVSDRDDTSAQIAVGNGAAVALGVPPAALGALGDDTSFVSTNVSRGVPAGSVAIASSAGSLRGTLHGAFAFLRALGFEFFAPNATRTPRPPIILPDVDSVYTPQIVSRDLTMASSGIGSNLDRQHVRTGNCSAVAKANHWHGGKCESASIWRPGTNLSAALGLNGEWSFAPVGGYVSPHQPPGFVATAYNLLVPSLDADANDCAGPGTNEPHRVNTPCPAVFRQHPDWFTCGQPAGPCNATTINQTYNSQPCWLAPGVVDTMTHNILKILRADPTIKLISVSNMDGGVSDFPCALDMVAAAVENTTGAGNFYAVRDIAAAVAKEFPHVMMETLAYNGAQQPPKQLKFADNIIVRIAGFNMGHVSLHAPANADKLSLVQEWMKVAKTVYVWDGISEDVILPHGDYTAQALHIKELAQLGVTGYFAEASSLPGSDMNDLRAFMAGRMVFDPSLDVDELLREFLETYYGGGAAAHSVGKYTKLISTAYATANTSVDFTGQAWSGGVNGLEKRYCGHGPNSSVFANETVLRATALLNHAMQAASEPKFQQRIAIDLMHLQYVLLVRWDSLRANATATRTPWPAHETKEAEFELFAAACNASGILGFKEMRKYPPRCGGLSPCWTGMEMTLASFRAELFPSKSVVASLKSDDTNNTTDAEPESVLRALAEMRAEIQAMKSVNIRAEVPQPHQAVLDVTTFGADRTGTEPSDDAINAAITVLNDRGGMSTILFPPGVYRVDAPLLPIAGNHIVIEGSGALVDWRNTTDHACLMQFQAVAENATELVSDVQSGQDSIEFTTEIHDHQLVRLNSSEQYYNTTADSTRHNKKGELLVGIFTTECVNETYTACGQTRQPSRTLHPDGKSPIFGYQKALTSATIITPSTDIAVRGLSVRGAGAHLLTVALSVDGAQGVIMSECSFEHIMAAIGIQSAHLVHITSCRFNRINHVGLGYSVMIGCFNVGISMTNCIGDKGRHFMTTVGNTGIARGISVRGNTFRGSILGAIGPHAQGYDITIENNHISDSNVGILSRSPNTVIRGNTIVNCGVPNVSMVEKPTPDQHAIYACEQGHINLVVSDNTILYDVDRWGGKINNQTIFGIAILVNGDPSQTGTAEFVNSYVVVKGNTIQPLPHGVAIDVSSMNGSSKGKPFPATVPVEHYPRRIHIEGNTVLGAAGYVTIALSGGSPVGAERVDAFLSGNTVDAPTNGVGLPQIHASQLKSITIARNTLPSSSNPSVAAIVVENVDDVSINSNTLSPAETSSRRGCLVPQLTNVSVSSVESFGTGCHSGVSIPLPRGNTGAVCDVSALEITVWTSTGVLAKTIVMAAGHMVALANTSVGAETVSIALREQNHTAILRTASGAPLSFRATPLKSDDAIRESSSSSSCCCSSSSEEKTRGV
eukprot:SAG22_NODE_347_length_11873_cov_15.313997_3_plen_1456_part_00